MPFFCMPSKKPAVKPTTQKAPVPVAHSKPQIVIKKEEPSVKPKPVAIVEKAPPVVQEEKIEVTPQPVEAVTTTSPPPVVETEPQLPEKNEAKAPSVVDEPEEDLQSQDEQPQVPLLQHVIESVLELDLTISKPGLDIVSPSTGIDESSPHSESHVQPASEIQDDVASKETGSVVDGSLYDPNKPNQEAEYCDKQHDDSTTEEKLEMVPPLKKSSKFFQCCIPPSKSDDFETTTQIEQVAA